MVYSFMAHTSVGRVSVFFISAFWTSDLGDDGFGRFHGAGFTTGVFVGFCFYGRCIVVACR